MLFGICYVASLLSAQPAVRVKPSEDEVKAAYLFNFGKFVRWPMQAAAIPARSFDICVLGRDPVSEPLTKITANEQVDGLPVRTRELENPTQARSCAIVYMGNSEAARIDQDLAALHGSQAMTVSDLSDFLERGGMLQFLLEGNRVRFAVNLDAVGGTDLQLSSELLKVAARVSGKPRRGVSP